MLISSGLVRAPATHVLVPDSQPQPATCEQSRPQVKAPQFGPLCDAVGAEAGSLQTPINISEPVVRPPEIQAFLFLLQPHVVSEAQSWPQVNREQPAVGEGVGAGVGAEPAQVPISISAPVVRPPETQASRFLLQPQPRDASDAQSRPHSAAAQPAVGEGEGKDVAGIKVRIGVGIGVGSGVLGSDVLGIGDGIGVGSGVVGVTDGIRVGSDVLGSEVVGKSVGALVGHIACENTGIGFVHVPLPMTMDELLTSTASSAHMSS